MQDNKSSIIKTRTDFKSLLGMLFKARKPVLPDRTPGARKTPKSSWQGLSSTWRPSLGLCPQALHEFSALLTA